MGGCDECLNGMCECVECVSDVCECDEGVSGSNVGT